MTWADFHRKMTTQGSRIDNFADALWLFDLWCEVNREPCEKESAQ